MYRIIYDGKSEYGRYRVVERNYNDRPSRLLLSGEKSAPQSGIALDDNPELLFDYNQRLFEVALSLNPQSILVIGGGALTLPNALLGQLTKSRIDVIELDPLLPRLARKYFQVRRDARLKVLTTDGRSYIDNCRKNYDLIFVDAFSDYDIPRSLLTIEASRRYAELLAPNGTIALNIIARYRGSLPTLTHQLIASFGEAFKSIEVYPADPSDDQDDEQNLIFIASHQASPNLDYLMSVQVFPEKLSDESLVMRD